MTEQELANHITADPDKIGLSWLMTDAELYKLLHDKALGLYVPIATIKYRVLQWAGGNGLLDRLNTNQTAHIDSTIRSICRAAMLMFQDGTISEINFNEAENQALLGALIASGIMTAAEKTDFMDNHARQPASTLEKAFGIGTTAPMGIIEWARKLGGG